MVIALESILSKLKSSGNLEIQNKLAHRQRQPRLGHLNRRAIFTNGNGAHSCVRLEK